jgi:hypothetical protein
MIKSYKIVAIMSLSLLAACNGTSEQRKQVDNDIRTKAAGLEIDTVFVSTEGDQPAENTFVYGQTYYTNFKGISGFTIEDGDYFPDMEVFVLSKSGDTVLQARNLLGGLGQPQDVPVLNGSLILANPILSGSDYTANYKLYDTKSDAAFYSTMDFMVIRDPLIEIEENGLTAKEVYLFNRTKGAVITDGTVFFNTDLSMDFQMLEGFSTKNDKIELGMAILVTDANGTEITKVKDALAGNSYDRLRPEEVVQSTLKFSKGNIKSPVSWQVRLWDKNSEASLTATAIVSVENQ